MVFSQKKQEQEPFYTEEKNTQFMHIKQYTGA